MFKKYHTALMTLFYLLDVALALLALYLADVLIVQWLPPLQVTHLSPHLPLPVYFMVALIWAITFRLFPLYTSKRVRPLRHELAVVFEATVVSWCAFVAGAVVFDLVNELRPAAIGFGLWDLILALGFHLTLRLYLRFLRARQYNSKQVLIVGAGPTGRQVAGQLREHPWAGFSILGYLDDDPALQGQTIESTRVLGALDDACTVIAGMHPLDEVIIALPAEAYRQLHELVQAIQDSPVNVRVVPDLFGIASVQPSVEDLWGIPLIGIRHPAISGTHAFAKRLMDLTGAVLGAVVLAPLMAGIAIAIKLDSQGPVFFTQERVGENNRTFRIYKFRTMFQGAEAMLNQYIDLEKLEEPVFKLKHDPRVTPVGRVLRRTSLDELPQLFNVMRGDMSLVGPRPEEIQFVRRYNAWHRMRLMMKPGMTGPSQINGRADLSLRERVQLDLDYIANYSLGTDIRILIKTIPVIIRGNGCY